MEAHGEVFEPALFCAPLAGITHSAFRRLLADFGGYGAIFTELLAGSQVLREDANASTFLKRRRQEGKVIYQLLLTPHDRIPETVARVMALEPTGIDINCGCGGMYVRRAGGGISLFDNIKELEQVLRAVRQVYKGLLTVKTRLGYETPDWRSGFVDRLKVIEDCGVDAITVHPRFAKQHLKRHAQHQLLGWIAGTTALPIIANGDIRGPSTIARHPERFSHAAGIMVGRAAIARPWIFAAWRDPGFKADHLDTWRRFYSYVQEDFQPGRALEPLKRFAGYYAQNFLFGHSFHTALRNAGTVEAVNEAAVRFLSHSPALVPGLDD